MSPITENTPAEEFISWLVQAAAVCESDEKADYISEQIDCLVAQIQFLENCFALDYYPQ